MSAQTPSSPIALAAMLLLLAGCECPYPRALTGSYTLESANSAAWTNGSTLTPPAVTGVLGLEQSHYGVDWAFGNARMVVTHTSGSLAGRSTNWVGTYSNDPDGGLLMTLNDVAFEGAYMSDGDELTTELSADLSESGASPVGTLIWKRKKDSDS